MQGEHSGHRAMTFKQFLENHKKFLQTDFESLQSQDSFSNVAYKLNKINHLQKDFLQSSKDIFTEVDNGYSRLIDLMASKSSEFTFKKESTSLQNLIKDFTGIINCKTVEEFNGKFSFLTNCLNVDVKKFSLKDNNGSFNKEMDEYKEKINEYTQIFFAEMPILQKKFSHLLNFHDFCQNKSTFLEKLLVLTSQTNQSAPPPLLKSTSISKKKERMLVFPKGSTKPEKIIERKIQIKGESFKYDAISGDQKYLKEEEVFCCFCNESSTNTEFIKKLGFMFGPYVYKEQRDREDRVYYCHELCALWTSGITMDKKNSIKNSLIKEAKRTKILSCVICQDKGAGVGCQIKSCKFNGHFKCLLDFEDVVFDFVNFRIYCGEHLDHYEGNLDSSDSEKSSKEEERDGKNDIREKRKEQVQEERSKEMEEEETGEQTIKKRKLSNQTYQGEMNVRKENIKIMKKNINKNMENGKSEFFIFKLFCLLGKMDLEKEILLPLIKIEYDVNSQDFKSRDKDMQDHQDLKRLKKFAEVSKI